MTTSFNRTRISIPIGKIELQGELTIPLNSRSLVIFSHGNVNGNSKLRMRNNLVTNELHKHQIATFLFDLLTKEEDELYTNRFNIDMLTVRLIYITNYISALPQCSDLSLGYFGSFTGTAASLKAASFLPGVISAIVSQGGRPDLAMESVGKVQAATLLIAGDEDSEMLWLKRQVYDTLKCKKELDILPDLFEEQGTLQKVAEIAAEWFTLFLQSKKKYARVTS